MFKIFNSLCTNSKTKRRSIQESKVNPKQENLIYNSFVKHNPGVVEDTKKTEVKAPDVIPNNTRQNKENVDHRKNTEFSSHDVNDKEDVGHHRSTIVTSNDVKNFLKKRIPLYNSSYELDEAIPEKEGADYVFQEDYSRRCTSSKLLFVLILHLQFPKSVRPTEGSSRLHS